MSSEHTLRYADFISGPGTFHSIVHGLNTLAPYVVVFVSPTQMQIIPDQILAVDPDTVEITTTTSITIYGRIL